MDGIEKVPSEAEKQKEMSIRVHAMMPGLPL